MPRPTPSPIDLPESPLNEDGLGWTFGVIVVASLFLLAANAISLRDWIDEQTPSPFQAQAAETADQWLAITQAIGIGVPRDLMHAQWKRAEAVRFPGSAKEGDGAEAPIDQR